MEPDDQRYAGPGPRSLRNAWLWVASLPFAFALALVLAQQIVSWEGYQAGGTDPIPILAALGGYLPAIVIVLVPSIFALRTGLRANREGEERGLLPAALGGALGGFFLITNLAGLFGVR